MDDSLHRVALTGIGAVSCAGPSAPDLWHALLERRSTAPANGIPAYQGPAAVPDAIRAGLDRPALLALDAAIQAVSDARIGFTPDNALQVGAVFGTAYGNGPQPAEGAPPRRFFSTGLAGVATGLNVAGPVHTISADAASGLAAIGQAFEQIQRGETMVAVAGGAEAPLRPDVREAYAATSLLSARPDARPRPYDTARDGIVLGEGAAAVVLERLDIAIERGARIYAEVLGAAQSNSPAGDQQPPTDVAFARRAIGEALRRADRGPNEVDLVLAAGGSTVEGDKREVDLLERAFGQRILDTYVTTITPVTGFTVGASGALATVAAAFALTEQTVPPHATLTAVDSDCALDFTTEPQRDHLQHAAIASYGVLGQNAALIIARYDPPA